MHYRTVDGKVTHSNFTPEHRMRYTNNINMLHRRLPGMRATETLLYPVDITEDADEEPGYLTGFELRVYKGGDEIKLTRDQADNLNALLDRALGEKWLISDLRVPIRYKDTSLPVEWVQRLTPYILERGQSIEDGFLVQSIATTCPRDRVVASKIRPLQDGSESEPWFDDLESDSEEDGGIDMLYVTDLQPGDPRKTFTEIYFRFLDALVRLYQEGTIAGVDAQFVSAWELREDRNYRGLYHPKWTNTLVAPDQSNYLLRVLTDGKPESYADEIANPVFDFYGKNRCVK